VIKKKLIQTQADTGGCDNHIGMSTMKKQESNSVFFADISVARQLLCPDFTWHVVICIRIRDLFTAGSISSRTANDTKKQTTKSVNISLYKLQTFLQWQRNSE